MKNCPNCKYEVNDTAKFCKKCGFNIKKYEEETADIYCEECGAKIDSDSDFCEECGFKLKENASVNLNAAEGFDFEAMSNIATEQLFEKEGFKVENGVLLSYSGSKRTIET